MADVHVNRRVLGSGTVRWRLQWREPSGKQRVATFPSETSARRWEAIFRDEGVVRGGKLLAEADLGQEAARTTVAAAVERHINGLTGVTEGTRGKYRRIATNDIIPTLGELALVDLDTDVVSRWVNDLQKKGLSGKTIANVHGLLSGVCKRAVRDRLMPYNPCLGMRLPSPDRRPPVFLTPEEVAQLITAINPHYRDLIIVLVSTGMRWGEATALKVGSVRTLVSGSLAVSITQAWKDVDEGPMELGPPKTRRSRRTIPVPFGTPAYDALTRSMLGKRDVDLIFTSPRGYVLRQRDFFNRAWSPAMEKLGWKNSARRPRIHDLRHTAASIMLTSGDMDIGAVSRVLGHDKTSTTVNIYGHVRDGAAEAAVGALGGVLAAALAPPSD